MNLGEKLLRAWFRKSNEPYTAKCECFHLGERFLVVLFSRPHTTNGRAFGLVVASIRERPRGLTKFRFRLNGSMYTICSRGLWETREQAVAAYMKWLARRNL